MITILLILAGSLIFSIIAGTFIRKIENDNEEIEPTEMHAVPGEDFVC